MRSSGRRSTAAGIALLATVALAAPVTAEPVETGPYEPTVESLESHPLPQWYDDAKFGIFVHWGAYSVPAWGPRGSYAEWYWSYLNNPGSPTFEHHRDTYGEDVPYDRFLDDWKAENFDADAWIDLFNDAGAKYFVLTSKHHDGMALWDTATSTRDAVDRGPGRDLAGELFATAREDGRLRAGFYYSLYEWFNPDYSGRQPTNPYTGEEIPYTGVEPVEDYVQDYMKPQMYELIDRYDPDLLWCDGEWERDSPYWDLLPVLAHYYNQAADRADPKDVVVANRCRIKPGQFRGEQLDFTTPEYEVESDITEHKWESSRGIGRSYGYNRNEPISDYLTSDQLIDSLVDIVSKNGNLLLNVGPRADGTIPELQQQRLRDIGAWLRVNGEAIYGTTYYNHAEEPAGDDDVRYTVKDGALYAIALDWPGRTLTLGGDLPFGEGTTVDLLGSDAGPLDWRRTPGGTVEITTPERVRDSHAHVFRITTPGVRQLVRTRLDLPTEVAPGSTVGATVRLTNTGRTTSPDVRLDVRVPDGWSAEPRREVVPSLKPGESATVPVVVSVPPGARGEQRIEVTTRFGKVSTSVKETVTLVLPNVALGRPATQQGTAWDGEASRAVDGNVDGDYGAGSVTHTTEPSHQAWWQVDLGEPVPVDSIEIWNRTDCCAQRLSDYWVLVSETPITADSLEEARTAPGVTAFHRAGQAGRPTTIDVGGLQARYVRVQLESEVDPLSLAEVKVRSAG